MEYVSAVRLVAAMIERAQADVKGSRNEGIPRYCEVEPRHSARWCADKMLVGINNDLKTVAEPTAEDVMQAVMDNLDG